VNLRLNVALLILLLVTGVACDRPPRCRPVHRTGASVLDIQKSGDAQHLVNDLETIRRTALTYSDEVFRENPDRARTAVPTTRPLPPIELRAQYYCEAILIDELASEHRLEKSDLAKRLTSDTVHLAHLDELLGIP
jgi:hypothetical protein